MTEIGAKIAFLTETADAFYARLSRCDICPRNCRIDRLGGELGYCGMGRQLRVYTAFLHQGEEPPISAGEGSGTIFFSGCNVRCAYCQNWRFSHKREGTIVEEEELARLMLTLQKKGASNINLVTPTHYLPQITKALLSAYQAGLSLPVVYNTSGYETTEALTIASGCIDIYLTDMRYFSASVAGRFSNAPDYPHYNQKAIPLMVRAKRNRIHNERLGEGVIIRHLALPGHSEESRRILTWIKNNASQALCSLMFQYQPYYQADRYDEINRRVTQEEYESLKAYAQELGIEGWIQERTPSEELAGVYFQPRIEELLARGKTH